MSDWQKVCKEFKNNGCRETCPLKNPCETKVNDTEEKFNKRMNYQAVLWINRGTV